MQQEPSEKEVIEVEKNPGKKLSKKDKQKKEQQEFEAALAEFGTPAVENVSEGKKKKKKKNNQNEKKEENINTQVEQENKQ